MSTTCLCGALQLFTWLSVRLTESHVHSYERCVELGESGHPVRELGECEASC